MLIRRVASLFFACKTLMHANILVPDVRETFHDQRFVFNSIHSTSARIRGHPGTTPNLLEGFATQVAPVRSTCFCAFGARKTYIMLQRLSSNC